MRIVERRIAGYRIACGCERDETFVQSGGTLCVECPFCGRTMPMADLVAVWLTEGAAGRAAADAAD